MTSEKKKIDFNNIKSKITWFIEKIEHETLEQGRNTVYAVKIYEGDIEGQYCVTMGYIEDDLRISHIEGFGYYFYIKENFIVLDYDRDFSNKYEFENAGDIKQLTDKRIISNKINKEEETIGVFPGYVFCFEEGNIKKVFYENDEEIPFDKAIFKYSPPAPGSLIELDSSSFKQMLKDKQNNK